MKFLWCTIHVQNMDDSLQFYQEVIGLPLNRRFQAGEGMEIAFLGSEPTQIELICSTKMPAPQCGENLTLGFAIESVEDSMEIIKQKGYALHSGPFQPNPHIRYFYVQDPNGVKIQLAKNL